MNRTTYTDHLFTIEGFFSQQECQSYIDLSESLGYEVAAIDGGRVVRSVRNNDRVFYENPVLGKHLFERLHPFLLPKIGNSELVGLNERFRFYRYQPGHRFHGHQDNSFIRDGREASYYTFMIYLNDDFKGGETTFTKHRIIPKQGMALVFLHQLFHEGSEVLSGTKYVLRTDVMYRLKDHKRTY